MTQSKGGMDVYRVFRNRRAHCARRRMLTKSTDWQSVEKACKPRKLYLQPRELT